MSNVLTLCRPCRAFPQYIFSKDGTQLLGGMCVGDVSDFVKLVAITKKKKPLDVPPADFIIGKKGSLALLVPPLP
jgi:hypothetical protein